MAIPKAPACVAPCGRGRHRDCICTIWRSGKAGVWPRKGYGEISRCPIPDWVCVCRNTRRKRSGWKRCLSPHGNGAPGAVQQRGTVPVVGNVVAIGRSGNEIGGMTASVNLHIHDPTLAIGQIRWASPHGAFHLCGGLQQMALVLQLCCSAVQFEWSDGSEVWKCAHKGGHDRVRERVEPGGCARRDKRVQPGCDVRSHASSQIRVNDRVRVRTGLRIDVCHRHIHKRRCVAPHRTMRGDCQAAV